MSSSDRGTEFNTNVAVCTRRLSCFLHVFKWIAPRAQAATVKLVAQAFSSARDDTTDFYISAGNCSNARAGFSTPPLPHGAHQRSSVK